MKINKNDICNINTTNNIYVVKRCITNDEVIYYIFAGILQEDLFKLIKKIQTTKKISNLSEKNLFDLKKNIGKGMFEYISQILINENSIILNDIILIDDTIANIKKKIMYAISEEQELVPLSYQYLWIKKKINWNFYEIYTFFYNCAKNKTIKKEELIKVLKNITGNTYLDGIDIDNENIDITKLINIMLTNPDLKMLEVTMGLDISINNKIRYYLADPFKFLNDYNPDAFDDDFTNEKNYKILWRSNKILKEFGNINNNTIDLILLPDIINYCKDLSIDYKQEKFYYKCLYNYWPSVSIKNIEKDETLKIPNLDKYINLNTEFWKLYTLPEVSNNYINQCGIMQAVIQVNYPFDENFIDLKKIFDLYQLDFNSPFIKFRNKGEHQSQYKLYKPVTEERFLVKTLIKKGKLKKNTVCDVIEYIKTAKGNKQAYRVCDLDKNIQETIFEDDLEILSVLDKPYISMKEILNWKKNYIFDKNTGKLRNISNVYCLVIKILFDINYDKNTGKSENKKYLTLNIFQDGRLEIKISADESDNVTINSLRNAIFRINEVLTKINKINYSKDGQKIKLPDIKFIERPSINTKLVYLTTYIISNKLKDIGKITQNINEITKFLYPILKLTGSKKNQTDDLELKYSRVNEFEDMDPVASFISELFNDDKKEQEILQYLIKNFKHLESVEDAKLAYKNWYENVKAELQYTGKGLVAKMKANPGIILKLNLIEKNVIKITVDGITDIFYLSRINFFVNSIFNFCIEKELYTKLKNNFDLYKKIGTTKLIEEKNTGEKLQDIVQEINTKNDFIVLENNDSDNDELGNYLDILDEIEDFDDDNDINNIQGGNGNKNKKTKDDEDKVKDDGQKNNNTGDLVNIVNKKTTFEYKKTDVSRYFSLRLSSMDKVLFAQSTGYTSKCQNVQNKQPVSLTREQLDTINNHDNELSKIHKKPVKSYTYSLNYGSPGYNNNFICPLVWCIKCEMSLPYDKDILLNDPKKDILTDSICPKCNGAVITDPKNVKKDQTIIMKLKVKKNKSEFIQISDMDKPYFLKARHEKDYCWPCCGSKDKQQDVDTKICLGTDNGIIKEVVKDNKNILYILDAGKNLDNNRLGMLPDELNTILGNKKTNIVNSKLKENATEFLRYGANKSVNKSFLENLSKIYDIDISLDEFILLLTENLDPLYFLKAYNGDLVQLFNISGKNYIETADELSMLKSWLDKNSDIKNLFSIDTSKDISLPTLKIGIKDLLKTSNNIIKNYNLVFILYKSFENFINYLKSNSDIDHQYLWMLLTYPIKNVFPKGLNIFFFETDILSSESEVSLLCPKICEPDKYYNINSPNIFFLKYNNKYEIIAKVSMINTKQTINFIHLLGDNFHIIDGLKYYFIKSCQTLNKIEDPQYFANSLIDILSILKKIGLKNEGFLPEYQFIDNYFKVIGIITKNKTFIPTYPSEISLDLKIHSDFSNKTIDPFLLHQNLKKIYKKSKGKYNCLPSEYIVAVAGDYNYPKIIKEQDVYLQEEFKKYTTNWIIGVKFKNEIIIPTLWKKFDNEEDLDLPISNENYSYNVNDEILYNIKYLDNRIIDMNKMIYSEEVYELLTYELSKYFNFKYYNNSVKIDKIEGKIRYTQDLYDKAVGSKKDKIVLNKKHLSINEVGVLIKKYKVQKKKLLKQDTAEELRTQYKEKVYTILNDVFLTDIQKRDKLYSIFDEILGSEIDTVQLAIEKEIDENIVKKIDLFKNTKYRKRCSESIRKEDCENNIFCSWDKSKCKLVIPETDIYTSLKTNRDRFIYKLVDELIRNKFKRTDILENNINETMELNTNKNYFILYDNDITGGKLKQIYENGQKKFFRKINIFDTDTEKIERKLELLKKISDKPLSCQEEITDLHKSWTKDIDSSFKILKNDGNNDCIFQIIASVVNSYPLYKENHTSYMIRKKVSDNVFLISNIENLSNMHNKLLRYNHIITTIDLELISYTFNITFIIINNIKNKDNTKNIKIIRANADNLNVDEQIYVLLNEKTDKKIKKYELIYQPDVSNYYKVKGNNCLPEQIEDLFKYNIYSPQLSFLSPHQLEFRSIAKIYGFIIKDDVHIDAKREQKKVTLRKSNDGIKVTKDYVIKNISNNEEAYLLNKDREYNRNVGKVNKEVVGKVNKEVVGKNKEVVGKVNKEVVGKVNTKLQKNNKDKNAKQLDKKITKSKKTKKTKKSFKIFADVWKKNKKRSKSTKVKAGECIFPFKANGIIYTDKCVTDPEGDWCATSIKKPMGKPKNNWETFGYCIE